MTTQHLTPKLLNNSCLVGQDQGDLDQARRRLLPLIPAASYVLEDAPAALTHILKDQDVQEFPVLVHTPSQAVLRVKHASQGDLQGWPDD